MFGLGSGELLLILAVVALLFGPSIVAFVAGYALGQRRASSQPSAERSANAPQALESPSSAPEDASTDGPPPSLGADASPNEQDGDLHV